jgi:chromosomal replication initiator protein
LLYNKQKHANQIINDVCDFYGITMPQIKGKCRLRSYVKARFVSMYLLRKRTDLTFMEIARMFHRDHTSVIYAFQTIEEVLSLKYDNDYQNEIKKILSII